MYTIDCEIKKGFDLLPWSSIEHLAGAHLRSELVMESLPVVHWHLVSVREQPEAGTAAAKQGSYSNKASVSIFFQRCFETRQRQRKQTYSARRNTAQILRRHERRSSSRNSKDGETHIARVGYSLGGVVGKYRT
jgi:hypothetical protein